LCKAQSTPAPDASTAAAKAASLSAASAPSDLLQPAVDGMQQTLAALKLDKWKGGSVRTEAQKRVASIQSDLKDNLPGLIKAADAAPAITSRMLPVSRHVDALYDELLRVVEAARVAAPGDQVDALSQALVNLGKSRRSLDDRLQETATAQEKQLSDVQGALQAQAQVKCPVVAPAPSCTPAAPAKKAVKRKPKPATSATPPPAPAAKPNQ
jgi:hypothetical protein